jgi:hypothetical protein
MNNMINTSERKQSGRAGQSAKVGFRQCHTSPAYIIHKRKSSKSNKSQIKGPGAAVEGRQSM